MILGPSTRPNASVYPTARWTTTATTPATYSWTRSHSRRRFMGLKISWNSISRVFSLCKKKNKQKAVLLLILLLLLSCCVNKQLYCLLKENKNTTTTKGFLSHDVYCCFFRKKKKKRFSKNFHTLPFFPWEFIDYYLSFKYCFLKNWTNKLKKNNSVLTMMAIYDCWHCSWKYRENRISTTHCAVDAWEKKPKMFLLRNWIKKSVVVEEHAQWAKIWRKVEFRDMLQTPKTKKINIFWNLF